MASVGEFVWKHKYSNISCLEINKYDYSDISLAVTGKNPPSFNYCTVYNVSISLVVTEKKVIIFL